MSFGVSNWFRIGGKPAKCDGSTESECDKGKRDASGKKRKHDISPEQLDVSPEQWKKTHKTR